MRISSRASAQFVSTKRLLRGTSLDILSLMASPPAALSTIAPITHAHTDRMATNCHLGVATMLRDISTTSILAQMTDRSQESIKCNQKRVMEAIT
jgi:hypothetical protein